MKPTSGAFTMPRLSQACLLGYTPSPQQAFQGDAAHQGTASYLADSQRLTGYLVYPEGLPIQMDPSSIPSYSFHGAHMDSTTLPAASWRLSSTLSNYAA